MKRHLFLFLFLILLVCAAAASDHDFTQARNLIEQAKPIEDLDNDDLEMIGDYFMELMLGSEQHERMDNMMGGEGSASLRQAHINIALNNYEKFLEDGTLGHGNTMMDGGIGSMMMPGYGHSFLGFGFFGFIIMIIFWGFVIWLIYWLIRDYKDSQSPKNIIKKRYAKGDITKKEYEKRMKRIR